MSEILPEAIPGPIERSSRPLHVSDPDFEPESAGFGASVPFCERAAPADIAHPRRRIQGRKIFFTASPFESERRIYDNGPRRFLVSCRRSMSDPVRRILHVDMDAFY